MQNIRMETKTNTFENFPEWLLEKWQGIADVLAETIGVTAAFITKTEDNVMEVFISSHSENNPYPPYIKENTDGLYSETVIKTQQKLLVTNALTDKAWNKNPDIKNGLIAYLGFPLNFPDNQPFGTLCLLDNKERSFTQQNEKLVQQFKNVIELDLALLQSFDHNTRFESANIVHEIAERKQADEKLQESERMYRNLFEKANEGLILLTMDGKIAEANQSFAMMHGYTVSEIKNMDIKDLDVLNDRAFDGRAEVMNRLYAGEVVRFEVEHYHKDGHVITMSDTVSIINIGVEKFFLAFHQDITGRKLAEEQLAENKEKYRGLSEASFESIFLSEKGICIEQNHTAEKIFGYTSDEAIGRYGTDWIVPEDRDMVLRKMLSGTEEPYEARALRKDGTTFPCMLSGKMMHYKGRDVRVTSLTDITERKQAEDRILELNRDLELRVKQRTSELEAVNKELETFSYSVSHDLKAPLRHISGFIDLFRENKSKDLNAEDLGYLDVISSSASDMGKLIDAILNFSRLNSVELQKKPICSSEMAQQVINFFEPDIQNRIVLFKVSSIPDITGDEELLRQVWINLISNAIKYTMKKTEAIIEIGSFSNDKEVTFFVKDNGAGYNMKYADKLFGVFKRLHKTSDFEGVGIGLANVNRIVMRHGGHCHAEGEVDNGATFYFTLPV